MGSCYLATNCCEIKLQPAACFIVGEWNNYVDLGEFPVIVSNQVMYNIPGLESMYSLLVLIDTRVLIYHKVLVIHT